MTLPFIECAAVTDARKKARRLVDAGLPVMLIGEWGVGRWTLASEMASALDASGALIERVETGDIGHVRGIDGFFRLFIRDVEKASAEDQRWLADAVGRHERKVGLVATCTGPEVLDTHLGTVVTLIPIQPLRSRPELSEWASYFLAELNHTHGTKHVFAADALLAIAGHAWPGNFSELRMRVARGVSLASGAEVRAEDLGFEPEPENRALLPLDEAVNAFKIQYVREVLDRCRGNRTHAARVLGVDPRTVFRFLEATRTKKEP